MPPAYKVPVSDGKGSSFQDYDRPVCLRMQMTHSEPSYRTAALILRMYSAERHVCLPADGDYLGSKDVLVRILEIAGNYFAPEAVDSTYRKVVRFRRQCRTDQAIVEYTVEFDLLRRKAESEMEIGAGFPGAFVSILGMQNAAPSQHEKSLVLARTQKSLDSLEVAATMRRLFGGREGAARQDVLITDDAEEPSGSDEDREVCATKRKTKR